MRLLLEIETDASEFADYANNQDGAVVTLRDGTHEFYDEIGEGFAALYGPNSGTALRFMSNKHMWRVKSLGDEVTWRMVADLIGTDQIHDTNLFDLVGTPPIQVNETRWALPVVDDGTFGGKEWDAIIEFRPGLGGWCLEPNPK